MIQWNISLGSILTILVIIGMGLRLDRQLAKFLIEHEMLMAWYCKENNIDINSLPTRTHMRWH